MIAKRIRYLAFNVLVLLLAVQNTHAQSNFDQKHLEVSLRMIGHQILLNAADSVSRVLPIVESNGQYRIEFESEFGFQPDDLVIAVRDIMVKNEAAVRYIVEVEECETEQVVYSFEVDNNNHSDIIPCKARGQSADCFSLVFTILEQPLPIQPDQAEKADLGREVESFVLFGFGALLLLGFGMFIFYRGKQTPKREGLIKLGKFQFDPRNALLLLQEQQTELTSKEADLLLLLHASANQAVKRETILSEIWEDEGNYVGRTLDVFISKLRAKLQADPGIRISNIRGVGYKLIVND